jgi:hypothetical protein
MWFGQLYIEINRTRRFICETDVIGVRLDSESNRLIWKHVLIHKICF